jgi:succinate-semialdehyde dehydrogenase/glutarate-semialdehyde dehydrogenase
VIDGLDAQNNWQTGTMSFTSVNPATEVEIARYAAHSAPEIDAALSTANKAFGEWSQMPIDERIHLMERCAELLEGEVPVIAQLMTNEMGKTFASAKGEVAKCASIMRYYVEHAPALLEPTTIATNGSASGVRYEPLGVILAIMPWNFPLWQVFRVLAPNLMAGNVVAVKHAPNVPGCAQFIEELFVRSGFPTGVVTNLFAPVDAMEGIIGDPRVAGVTLTGSEQAGRAVGAVAGRHLKKCVLELGGSDAFIVGVSADMDLAVPMAVTARVQNNGQACIAAKRYIVVRERSEEFITRFTQAMADVPMGDPMDPDTVLGPLASQVQLELLSEQVESSLKAGALALVGGVKPQGTGYFYPATVLTNVPATSRAGCEELFGPVAVVHVVEDLDAAVNLANATPWGLGASIWSDDQREIDAAITGIDVGMVFANALVVSMAELPFGGTKNSGIGRELADYGVREFTNVKSFFVA